MTLSKKAPLLQVTVLFSLKFANNNNFLMVVVFFLPPTFTHCFHGFSQNLCTDDGQYLPFRGTDGQSSDELILLFFLKEENTERKTVSHYMI